MVAQRTTNAFIETEHLHQIEAKAGIAALEALKQTPIENEMSVGVWNK